MTKEQMAKILRKIHPDWEEKEIQKGVAVVFKRQNQTRAHSQSAEKDSRPSAIEIQ